ncbi:MAG: HesA/MoeB/ThiF family protein [Candidatus Riesia sp.]|nr:HesA/MoeB/ThiF family protein [Candidatus Riesia sp.]
MYTEYNKYLRHIVLPEIGIENQDKISTSKVLCIGAGGLGSPAITYLTMLGVKNIHVIEFDNIDETNLNRQFIFKEKNIGKKKSSCVKKHVKELNSKTNIEIYNKKLNYQDAIKLFSDYTVILECTDNTESKLLISDAGIKSNVPVIHSSIFGFEGYICIISKNNMCYRCIYSKLNFNECIDYGVFGPIAGIMGILQASEAIKIILNKDSILKTNLLLCNLITLSFDMIKIKKNLCHTCN